MCFFYAGRWKLKKKGKDEEKKQRHISLCLEGLKKNRVN